MGDLFLSTRNNPGGWGSLGRKLAKKVASAAAAAVVAAGVVAAPAAASAAPGAPAAGAQGCSYGSGGPKADALCWVDFAEFGNVPASEVIAGDVTKSMTASLGRYTVTFDATISKGDDGAQGVFASALPTWGGSVLGNPGLPGSPYYVGTTGKPSLYQYMYDGANNNGGLRDTITLSDIKVQDTVLNQPVTSGYSLVMADAESTDEYEGFHWTSDAKLTEYTRVVPPGWTEPCGLTFTGIGTNTVDCTAPPGKVDHGRGIIMVSADAPTRIASSFRNDQGTSREGIAIAIVFSTATAGVTVNQDGGSNGQFTVTANNDSSPLASVTSGGGTQTTDPQQFIAGTEGTNASYTVTQSGGTTPTSAYDLSWVCTVNGETVTPTLSDDGLTATVNTPAAGSSKCVATAQAKGPSAGDDKKTINPNQTATLAPVTTPGKGAIESVVFDNGQTTKKVDGQGTWKITLNDQGQTVSVFTPEPNYSGPVTQQTYKVTDVNGLSATGTLDVTINVRPTAGPNAVTVDQGQTANLTPTVTQGTGALTKVQFDNGQNTKTVAGEGTWTLTLTPAGTVQAQFVPVDGFTGAVTQQQYTVVDANGLSAMSTLDVTIRPAANPASTIVDQGETATLNPTVKPGSSDLTSAVFDNGQATKTVEGQGTWTLTLVDNKVQATFVPVAGFTGPVGQQKYTVTDKNGEKATSTLDVTIRPVTKDENVVINPNQVATLNPQTTPGSAPITSVTFSDGST